MNAFLDASQVEQEALKDILPFLEHQSDGGRYVLTDKGRLSKELQSQYGDAMSNASGRIVAVEFKAEAKNEHDNFFLETWSNLSRFTIGWMNKLNADVLLYYFLEERLMYSIPFTALRRWAFGVLQTVDGRKVNKARIYSFREHVQQKRGQMNDTWGRCVPIEVLTREMPSIRVYQFDGQPGVYSECRKSGVESRRETQPALF